MGNNCSANLLSKDFCNFAEYAFKCDLGFGDDGNKFGDHHREWFKLLWDQVKDIVEPGKHTRPASSKDNLLIVSPREHGKTVTMIYFMLFCFGKNPNLKIKYVTSSNRLAVDVLAVAEVALQYKQRLSDVFPSITADFTVNKNNLTVHGVNNVETGVGCHADIIIFDDIICFRDVAQGPQRIDMINRLFFMDWLNIGGRRHIVIGTPQVNGDVYTHLCQDSRWDSWKKPAIIDGSPLWPERWPMDRLIKRRKQIGNAAFDTEFMLAAV